jgi:maltooligosyltrehalose trehalohydrolase
VSFVHAMPFGAEVRDEGVRFRLWAPAARQVEVLLEDGRPRARPMSDVGDGWFEAVVEAAVAGTPYRFRIDGEAVVPDPASRAQVDDVHGPSLVVDPRNHAWRHDGWRGRPWHEAVVYELHVGTFSPEGSFEGVRRRLDHLVDLGITAIELMPVADFPGRRGWGYDGVLPFAPDATYGTPDDLKRLVDAAHGRGLMMILDVVYNHFGPEGNHLHRYAPQWFTDRVRTPWGEAIDFSRREVRDFAIHNALYWTYEFRFDGLRLDAVHAIHDDGPTHVLDELAERVRRHVEPERFVHLVLENERNEARYLERAAGGEPRTYTAQWNDDVHHALHVLATEERSGYYAGYADRPLDHLARCLTEGFARQGDLPGEGAVSAGTPSAHLPPSAFVSFLQNHDQVGNRAFGERLVELSEPRALRALSAVLLLAPQPPMLFMGEEWGADEPFLYFCDFHDELADAVREGRRLEFASFPAFRDEETRASIPDPNDEKTFRRSRLDWSWLGEPEHAAWLVHHRTLLEIRHREIVPRVPHVTPGAARAASFGTRGLDVRWPLDDGSTLWLRANLSDAPCDEATPWPSARWLYPSEVGLESGPLPPWSVVWGVAP